jgi:hypothetical protein
MNEIETEQNIDGVDVIDAKRARDNGYVPLTKGYRLPKEAHMLERVIADMRRGKIPHVLVSSNEGPEVWQKQRAGMAVRQP